MLPHTHFYFQFATMIYFCNSLTRRGISLSLAFCLSPFWSTVTITCCNTRETHTERATVALICELYYKCNYTSGSSDVDVCSKFAVN